MSTITNQQICHEYFYASLTDSNYPSNKNCGYKKGVFFSYNTAVAQLIIDRKGECVCLMSSNTYSPTTAKQMAYLRRGCPFLIIEVPTKYNGQYITPAQSLNALFADLQTLSNQRMTRAENRNAFLNTYSCLSSLMYHFDFCLSDEQEQAYSDFGELCHALKDSDHVKALKAKEREKAAAARKRTEELLQSDNIIEIIEQAYSPASSLPSDQKRKLQQHLDPNRTLSYVYATDYEYITSQGVHVSKREGDLLLLTLKAGRLCHGHKISHYTVIAVTDSIVKIGCHSIPMENLQALAARL